eukprot:8983065-Pyramimonas_sp.AAC.2
MTLKYANKSKNYPPGNRYRGVERLLAKSKNEGRTLIVTQSARNQPSVALVVFTYKRRPGR